ncbi:hypothetical protein LLY24_05565 [Halomonas sp. wenzhen-202101]|uniref:Ankyrin repeat domain-containing protein n=2 Tax=Halomonas dongshanensis TaxID=2890835 RepID=A0ABT2EB33_9GAMM|nr:hypothetical protein [Halomonas dongshanensis]MCS2608791.1 hypothetical protein [Halomonas dongshanensis]
MGHEEACWLLVRGGACVALKNHQGETASDIAQRKGHAALAVWLTRAQLDPNGLWAAPSDPDELPSSNRWDEAQQRHAREDRLVAYAGSIVHIPSGARYFVDDFERTLIGWHGTFDPPMDMGGYALFETPT